MRKHGDQHITKMPTEAVQLLYSALHMLNKDTAWLKKAPWNQKKTMRGYKLTHAGTALPVWVRRSRANFDICLKYAMELCKEYTRRFHKEHFVEHHTRWIRKHIPENFPATGKTPIPLCIKAPGPVQHEADMKKVVAIYREFYRQDKAGRIAYNHSKRPKWFPQ